jgi:hypothetical protein
MPNKYSPSVDTQGYIVLDHSGHWADKQLSPAEAVELATALLESVERSIYRGQIGTPQFYDADAILHRQESSLGKAIAATRKVFK